MIHISQYIEEINMTQKKQSTKKSSKEKPQKVSNSKKQKDNPKSNTQAETQNNNFSFSEATSQLPKEVQEKMEKMKKKIEDFKDKAIAKFDKYIMGIALLPPKKDEAGNVNKEDINLLVLVDDSDSEKMSKMELKDKLSAIIKSMAKETDKSLNVETIILSELWQSCYDQKSDLVKMIAICSPIYDKGVLSAVKISEIHKSMVIKKFEKYIVSYTIFGAFTKGRITPESDIDVAIVVDDTDVKKMTRAELKDKLRAIIISMGMDAKNITGVKRDFHIQVYILTDFWESIKEAHPVIFDLLRDGVPLYDRGIFMPWKQLLLMGKIRPSDESIEMFMNSGDQMLKRVEFKLREIAMEDLFLAILTPSQAALMCYGLPPPAPKETPGILQEVFVKKEKILEQKYVDILSEIIKTRKDIEHGKLKQIDGKRIDDLLGKANDYLKRIQSLFKEIDETKNKEYINEIYEQTITAVRDALILEGNDKVKTEDIEKLFKQELIDKGKLPEKMIKSLKQIVKDKKDFDLGKLSKNEVIKAKKIAKDFIKTIVEYMQRKRARELERSKLRIKYGDKFAEILLLDNVAFIIPDLDAEEKEVQKAKINKDGSLGKIEESSFDELEESLAKKEIFEKVFIKQKVFESLKNIFETDFELLINN
jgi:predicted nucleotidyltransferase